MSTLRGHVKTLFISKKKHKTRQDVERFTHPCRRCFAEHFSSTCIHPSIHPRFLSSIVKVSGSPLAPALPAPPTQRLCLDLIIVSPLRLVSCRINTICHLKCYFSPHRESIKALERREHPHPPPPTQRPLCRSAT